MSFLSELLSIPFIPTPEKFLHTKRRGTLWEPDQAGQHRSSEQAIAITCPARRLIMLSPNPPVHTMMLSVIEPTSRCYQFCWIPWYILWY